MLKRLAAAVALSVFTLVAVTTATAVTPGQKCASSKKKEAGKKAKCREGCDSKAVKKGLPFTDQTIVDCNGKCTFKFSKKWDTIEQRGGCVTSGDKMAIEGKVDMLQSDLRSMLGSAPPSSKCTSSVYKEAGKKASCKLRCHARAQKKGLPITDPSIQDCLNKCTLKFLDPLKGKCPKAVSAGDCINPVNCATIEGRVDAFVEDTASELPTQASTTSTTTSTVTTSTSTSTSTTPPTPCNCCANTKLSFITGAGSGDCGAAISSDGTTFKNLTCGGLYFGGGGNSVPLPATVPDMGESIELITNCDSATGAFTVAPASQADLGDSNDRRCTKAGCKFGPPLPVPNTASTPTSTCVINTLASDASGTADCHGSSDISLPLNSEIYLAGDLFGARPGIQPCPICVANACSKTSTNSGMSCTGDGDCPLGTCITATVCHGGPNDGGACTPANTNLGTAGPTTHDCPNDTTLDIGGLPIGFVLKTGTITATAVPSGTQQRVFCGYCRDADVTGSFQQPANKCLDTTPGGPATGTCGGTFESCEQNNQGAFGPGGGGVQTLTETGSPSACLADGMSHASTLVSIFCIPPTFNATVDAAANLPGPGAVALPGTSQALP